MREYIKINKQTYDLLALEYDNRRQHISKFEEKTEVLGNSVLNHVTKKKTNSLVLEIGPGAGQMLSFFENNGYKTVGIELSSNMAKIAKKTSPTSTILNLDINDAEFLNGSFDIIYMGALIHLFPIEDAMKLMQDVRRWLKEKGILFINTTCNSVEIEGFFRKNDYLGSKKRFRRYWTEMSFENFVCLNGFSIKEKLYTNEVDRDKKWVAFICEKNGEQK
ncbi:class I SAM-dependent methyltransferase [Enterococcus sp. AZ126]|uniref:class I SAM-dependent methyltransferase n=1 Tax=Enterococcus sp. AZ126 TaxID=2774635 RepID=UPI003F1EF695